MTVTPTSMPTNSGRWVGSVPADAGHRAPAGPASRPAPSTKTIGRNRPSSMHSPSAVLYQAVLTVRPANAEPLLLARRGERVQHLGQAVRAGVEHRRALLAGSAIASAGADQHQRRGGQEVQRGELDLAGADLLAQVLRRAADHQPGDEHRDDREDQHAVQARADAAGRDLAEHHVEHRHHAAERGVRVVERVRPRRSRSAWSAAAKVAEFDTPNRASLPSIAAPTACGTVPWCGQLEDVDQRRR